ncbi:MAG TPA: hypothetical protein DCX07_07275 [Phycisphaerales bacterium]|nr:hypothetical protein [Phycisphaerales bacterium]
MTRAAGILAAALCAALAFSPAAHAEPKETLSVALSGKYPPFSFPDETGALVGFDVDVSREVARRLGREARIVQTEWDGILAGLLAGKYDAIIGSMAITPERAERVRFSRPYYVSGAQLFIRRENPHEVYSIDECARKRLRVGVVLGETYQHFLETRYPDLQVVTYKSSPDIFNDLDRNRLAGFVSDKLVGTYQIRAAGRGFVPVGNLLYREEIAIPVRKDDAELLEQINAALLAMRRDGTLDGIRETWFGEKAQHRTARMQTAVVAKKLLVGFAVTLAVAAAALLAGFVLAIPAGLVLNRRRGAAYLAVRAVVDFVRGTPVLIQLFFVYFGLGLAPLTAAVLTLSVNSMSYMAEVVRSGLMSVDRGQKLAGRALGLSRFQVFRLIVWPQAFRIAMPPLMNSVVALTKDTALISVISVGEVIREAQSIISVTFEPIRYYFLVAVMFFVVTFPLMKLAGRLEARIRQKGFAHD